MNHDEREQVRLSAFTDEMTAQPVLDAINTLAAEANRLERALGDAREALEEIRDLADGRADADCVGEPPRFVPNTWMQVQTICDEALRKGSV